MRPYSTRKSSCSDLAGNKTRWDGIRCLTLPPRREIFTRGANPPFEGVKGSDALGGALALFSYSE